MRSELDIGSYEGYDGDEANGPLRWFCIRIYILTISIMEMTWINIALLFPYPKTLRGATDINIDLLPEMDKMIVCCKQATCWNYSQPHGIRGGCYI
jgi:hypothetical protein